MDFPDSLSPFVLFLHRFWLVFFTRTCGRTDMFKVSSCWSTNSGRSVCRGPKENVTYELLLLRHCPACLVRLIWMVLELGS